MSNIVEFPTIEREWSKEDVDKLHSAAFRDLEGEVCDLERMGEIAKQLIMECSAREDGLRELELAQFAVLELAKMLSTFRANYEKRWYNEPVSP